MESIVSLIDVTKRFGQFTAVRAVSLDIRGGEFLTLLGPSGCGKTTLLRMISGFEQPSEGRVMLEGRDVTLEPPYRRNVNQVFQSYALFPHLNVGDNIAFGLRMKGLGREAIDERVEQAILMVSLSGMEHHKPNQLSGGQKQRVALARAIVCRPKVLLLDEPLSALDAKLRHAMQLELKRLQKRLGITFIYVTHDQEEALVMSDRIAVMNQGHIEQLDNVVSIYHNPRTSFVASFIGQANILRGELVHRNGKFARVRVDGGIELAVDSVDIPAGASSVLISIRPEKIHIQKHQAEVDNVFEAQVEDELFKGAMDQLLLRTRGGMELTAVVANESAMQEAFHKGDSIYCHLHPDDIVVVRDN